MSGFRTAVMSGGIFAQQVSMFVTGVVIGRVLGADDFGIFSLLRNGVLWLLPLASLGLDLAIQKHAGREGDPETFLPVYRTLRMITAALNLIALAIAAGVAAILSSQPIWAYVALTVLALPFLSDAILAAGYLRARSRPVAFSVLNDYVPALLRMVLTVIVAQVGPSLVLMLEVNAVVAVAAWAGLSLFQLRMHNGARLDLSGLATQLQSNLAGAWRIIRESVWMAISVLTYGSLRVADLFVLSFFVPAEQLGAYSAISAVATFVRLVPLALSQQLAPQVARHYELNDYDAIQRLMRRNTHLSIVAGTFIFAGIAAFGPNLHLIFGESFVFDPLLCFLLPLSWLVSSVLTPTGLVLSMTRYHRRESVLLLSGAVMLLVLLLVLVPLLGVRGAAIASSICFFTINIIRLLLAQAVIKRTLLQAGMILPVIVSLIASYAFAFIVRHFEADLLNVFLGCVGYTLVFGVYCLTLDKTMASAVPLNALVNKARRRLVRR